MNRKTLPSEHGMLFIYNTSAQPHFWMKNTSIPLSIAFTDNTKRILQIIDMDPYSTQHVVPEIPIHFAIEANRGWFKKNNIKIGDRFSFKKEIEKSRFLEQ